MPLQFARNPFFHLPALRHICSFLTEDMAGSTATAMVLSCLDYTNLLLFGCSAYNMAQFQHIQNTAAHIVLDSQRPCPAQQLLCHLYWLPLHFCTNYKIATLTSESLAQNQPHQLRTVSSPLGVIWASLTTSPVGGYTKLKTYGYSFGTIAKKT